MSDSSFGNRNLLGGIESEDSSIFRQKFPSGLNYLKFCGCPDIVKDGVIDMRDVIAVLFNRPGADIDNNGIAASMKDLGDIQCIGHYFGNSQYPASCVLLYGEPAYLKIYDVHDGGSGVCPGSWSECYWDQQGSDKVNIIITSRCNKFTGVCEKTRESFHAHKSDNPQTNKCYDYQQLSRIPRDFGYVPCTENGVLTGVFCKATIDMRWSWEYGQYPYEVRLTEIPCK